MIGQPTAQTWPAAVTKALNSSAVTCRHDSPTGPIFHLLAAPSGAETEQDEAEESEATEGSEEEEAAAEAAAAGIGALELGWLGEERRRATRELPLPLPLSLAVLLCNTQ